MSGSTNLTQLLKNMQPVLAGSEYVIANQKIDNLAALGSFQETEGPTVFVTKNVAEEAGVKFESTWALITLNVHSSLQAVGFLAVVTNALAQHDISVNAVSAYYHDHLFVPWKNREQAFEILKKLSSRQLTAVIFHGTMGTPQGNWFPWLKKQLENEGYTVFAQQLPTPEGQSLENWIVASESSGVALGEDSILIGHSLGGTFILHLLERLNKPIAAAYIVSAPIHSIGISEYDKLNSSFVAHDFDYKQIHKNAKSISVIHGIDDPYVPITQAYELGASLNVPVLAIPGGKHLNAEAGLVEFPMLFELIKKRAT